MTKEEGIFTVSEEEMDNNEAIVVAEDEIEPKTAEFVMPMGFQESQQEEKDEEEWRISKKPEKFIVFLVNEMGRLPKINHVLGNKSKMEKALGQYRKLNAYISQALQSDYDDVINTDKVDKIREVIEKINDQLEDALDKINKLTRQKKKMKRRGEDENELTKEAGTPHFNGFQMVITPFQRAIAGALINGKVSGGKDMEQLWEDVKKKYNMTDREQLEILQILEDQGYPVFKDRLRADEDVDPTETKEKGEWQANYYA